MNEVAWQSSICLYLRVFTLRNCQLNPVCLLFNAKKYAYFCSDCLMPVFGSIDVGPVGICSEREKERPGS